MDGPNTPPGGRVMSEFYQGTREAEFWIDRDPDRAGDRLQRALRDRRRWVTRLLRRRKARFLDGFISRLARHEEKRNGRHAAALVHGRLGGPCEADVVLTIVALNRSGWSIGEAAVIDQKGKMVRVISRA